MQPNNFSSWCLKLQQHANIERWRAMVVLAGDAVWTGGKVTDYVAELQVHHRYHQTSNLDKPLTGLIFDDKLAMAKPGNLVVVNRLNYAKQLGSEQQVIIFIANEDENDFDCNAFAALSGTLVAGGLFLLVLNTESVSTIETSIGNFQQRFWQLLASEHVDIIKQSDGVLPTISSLPVREMARPSDNLPNNDDSENYLAHDCITQEQLAAVVAMIKVVTGHRNRPLVLTADRGRGKSSALAIAASQLLQQTKQPLKIIVSAVSRAALNVFFSQVAKSLPSAQISANQVCYQQSEITFLPVDYILQHKPAAGVMIIDEAAAIPVYLLARLLRNYHRMIFATTIHGYEGAGRGFTIKFKSVLEKLSPHWRNMHINEPIRWAANDPLEKFVFDSCLLNANLANLASIRHALDTKKLKSDSAKSDSEKFHTKTGNAAGLTAWHTEQLSIRTVAAIELVNNEALLRAIFSVLVTAHYQTSPSDLKLLLDNPTVSVITLSANNELVGVAMLMAEGEVDERFVSQIKQNQRRLRDQFLPQSLLTHCGIEDSFSYRYQRVMRIAIHPSLQSQGLGEFFISQISNIVAKQGNDFLGASFGGNQALLNFWQQGGYKIARIGFARDKASGEHSCLVLKPLTSKALKINQVIAAQFYQSFDYLLADQLSGLSAEFVWQVLQHNPQLNMQPLAKHLQQAVDDFANEARLFSSCVYGLHQWLLQHCTQKYDADVLVLISRIFQKHAIDDICQQYKFTGKKALNQHLIKYFAKYN